MKITINAINMATTLAQADLLESIGSNLNRAVEMDEILIPNSINVREEYFDDFIILYDYYFEMLTNNQE